MIARFIHDSHLRVDRALKQYVSRAHDSLSKAINYSLFNGGKRLRPILLYATGTALSIPHVHLDSAACAVECIHAYSLVHDDLPAMDNADLRRGHLSCHKKFDEATAILAGDALLTLAFEILAASPSHPVKLIHLLAQAAGGRGMIEGQALDIASGKKFTPQQLLKINALKTGKLFKFCIMAPLTLLPHPRKTVTENLEKFATHLGNAYQIQDDLLDVESGTGKKQFMDLENNKVTLPSLIGIEKTKLYLKKLFHEMDTALEKAKLQNTILKSFSDSLQHRINS